MKKISLTASVSILLSACSSMIDHQTVNMTVKTPGAENAKCIIENQDLKYVAYSDETIEIMKSPHNLLVRCVAPGNREKTVHIKREISGWTVLNVANGFVPGTTYDILSRGVYDYPDEITVSFAGEAVKPYPLPAYETQDLRNGNHKGKVAYQGPGEVISEANRYDDPPPLQKKENKYNNSSYIY